MQDFVIVATFSLPSELIVAQGRLQSEGIECLTKDELTIQSYNFLSNAVGGVKLLVHKSKARQAQKILKDGGFLNDEALELTKVEKYLSNPENLKKVKGASLILLSVSAVLIIVVIIFTIINRPNEIQKITKYNWCLDHIVFENEVYYPSTMVGEIKLLSLYDCNEILNFSDEGNISIPGFESRRINSKWAYENGKLTIFDSDTLEFAFNGTYDIEFAKRELKLTSQVTSIYCYIY